MNKPKLSKSTQIPRCGTPTTAIFFKFCVRLIGLNHPKTQFLKNCVGNEEERSVMSKHNFNYTDQKYPMKVPLKYHQKTIKLFLLLIYAYQPII